MTTATILAPVVPLAEARCYIYGLRDPRGGVIRYVGKADDTALRLRMHLWPSQLRAKTRKNSWIKSLLADGVEPVLEVLYDCPRSEADEAERNHIAWWREMTGDRLTNGTEGGTGGAQPPEVAKAAGLKRRGRVQSSSERAGRKESLQTYWASARSEDHRRERARRAVEMGLLPPVRRGELNNKSVLSDAKVRELRERHVAGEACWELADAYGITRAAVSYLVTGATRREAGGPIREPKVKTRLTEAQVEEIRQRVASGVSQTKVAQEFGLVQSYVSQVVNGRRRKGVCTPNNKGVDT